VVSLKIPFVGPQVMAISVGKKIKLNINVIILRGTQIIVLPI
jgi:hypothetical protein